MDTNKTTVGHRRIGQMIANPDSATDVEVMTARYAIKNGSYEHADFATWGITAAQYCNGMFALGCRLAAISHGATTCGEAYAMAEALALATMEARAEQRRLDRIDDGAGY